MLRFTIAKVCNLDTNDDNQSAVLDSILRNCMSDDGWDVSTSYGKAMRDVGEKRYYFSKSLLSEVGKNYSDRTDIKAHTDGSKLAQLQDEEEQDPLDLEIEAKIKDVASELKQLEANERQLKQLISKLKACKILKDEDCSALDVSKALVEFYC